MIKFSKKGDWSKTISSLKNTKSIKGILDKYGEEGVRALQAATPINTGRLERSWEYKIVENNGSISIEWHNTDIEGGYNVAILVQYGHGTGGGTYVQGIDYINPALRPVFDEIANSIWEEVTK